MTSRSNALLLSLLMLLAPPIAFADWRVIVSTDSMTDKELRKAETRNESGHSFSIYRTPSGTVYANFSLSNDSLEVLDTRLPTYRIDKLPPVDLDRSNSVSRTIAKVGGPTLSDSRPRWVNFLLFHGEGTQTVGLFAKSWTEQELCSAIGYSMAVTERHRLTWPARNRQSRPL